MTAADRKLVKCRGIEEADRLGVVDCLARGFPYRLRDYWTAAFEKMSRRPAVDGYPKYGVLLETEGQVVGVLLQIHFRRGEGERAAVYCNLSSWCLDPEFRGYAAMLNSAATARKDVTYLNVSPARHTRRGIEALGFRRYCEGEFICLPALSRARQSASTVIAFTPDLPQAELLSPYERDILAAHQALGCRSLVVVSHGEAHPFVFLKRRITRDRLPCEQVIYCRDVADFVACAAPLGRYLLMRGSLICVVDANGTLSGLPGWYVPDAGPKYFKGPAAPSLGDLSFTELPLLGP